MCCEAIHLLRPGGHRSGSLLLVDVVVVPTLLSLAFKPASVYADLCGKEVELDYAVRPHVAEQLLVVAKDRLVYIDRHPLNP